MFNTVTSIVGLLILAWMMWTLIRACWEVLKEDRIDLRGPIHPRK